MKKEYLIAYDIGTSGTKATLFTTDGELVSSSTQEYDVFFDRGGVCEQDPDDWWHAVLRATKILIRDIDATGVRAVSFSGQMMGCTFVNGKGEPIRRSIIWSDTRAVEEEAQLVRILGEEEGYQLTGHRISCSYGNEKLMWVKKHEPEIYNNTYKVLNSKDYIILKMTGNFVTDYSDATGTNGLDIHTLQWSDKAFEAAGLDMNKMPELHHSIDEAGRLTHETAAMLGLPEGIPVICGGGDGPCANLGAGCIQEGQYYLTFGTSAWIAGTTVDTALEPTRNLMAFAHVIPGYYSSIGSMQAAGASYSYMKRTFFQEEERAAREAGISAYPALNELIASSPVGARNLIFLPYLTGERAPRWDASAAGCFIGMTMEHRREDYLRATIEGVAMNLNDILAVHRKHSDIHELILTGGGAKGDIVAQILADVLDCRLERPTHAEEATSTAAAVIAGVGAGIYDSFDAVHSFLSFTEPVIPNQENHEMYMERQKVFDRCYEALKDLYPAVRG